MPRMGLGAWLKNFIDEAKQDAMRERASVYRNAGVAAMTQARNEINSRYGEGWGARLTAAQVVKTVYLTYQSAEGLAVRIDSYVEDENLNPEAVAAAASWMDYHYEHFGLSQKLTPTQYAVDYLFINQGILGLPAVGIWQNTGGLRGTTPADNRYLHWRRKHPWVNPNFSQVQSIDEVYDSGEVGERFIAILESMIS